MGYIYNNGEPIELPYDMIKDGDRSLKEDIRDLSDSLKGVQDRDLFSFGKKYVGFLTYDIASNTFSIVNAGANRGLTCEVDITNYDSIALENLLSFIPNSSATKKLYSFAVFRGTYDDGELLASQVQGGNKSLFVSDYANNGKLTLYVAGAKRSDNVQPADYDNTIIAKANMQAVERAKSKAKRIVLVGDSLCGNTVSRLIKEFDSILPNFGYDTIISRCQGGSNNIDNLTRAGGIGVRVKEDFTIPESGSVAVDLGSAWIKRDGSYHTTPYNILTSPRSVRIKNVRGNISKADVDIAGLVVYNNSKAVIKTYSANGETVTLPSNSAFIRFCINNPQTGEAHLSVNASAINCDTEATISGYINKSGSVVSDSKYKCSDYISVNAGDSVYYDSLATSTGYVFTRTDVGESIKVGKGHIFFDDALYEDKEYTHIWFVGQNGGYEDAEDWAEQINSSARNFGENFVVLSTHLDRTTTEIIRQATVKFGCKYINLREYSENSSIYDAIRLGLISDTSLTKEDWKRTFVSDGVHQSDKLSYLWCMLIWNKLLELGYVEGDYITDARFFV